MRLYISVQMHSLWYFVMAALGKEYKIPILPLQSLQACPLLWIRTVLLGGPEGKGQLSAVGSL